MTERLDAAVAARGLIRSRNRAQREIRAGRVRVDGAVVTKPSTPVEAAASITVDDADPWVARSAHKLIGALDAFDISPAGRLCLDAGASTGGFTQVLLARGASHVWAVDVGHDQLEYSLRDHPSVENLEGHNLRDLTPAWFGGRRVQLTVADVSFISMTLFADRLIECTDGDLLLMVKPQFEAGRAALDKRGVVADPAVRAAAVASVAEHLQSLGACVRGAVQSQLPGPAGNIEYFLWAQTGWDGTRPGLAANAIESHLRTGAESPLELRPQAEQTEQQTGSFGGEEAR